jgi:hypothetical protein
MSADLFEANELVSRSNVNDRITAINGMFPVSIADGGTGSNTATGARTNLAVMTGVQLYYNASGTQSTIQLDDSSANYSYLEIYYMNDDDKTSCVKIDNPNGKSVELSMIAYWNGLMYLRTAVVSISGTSITWNSNYIGWATVGANGTTTYNNNLIYITKIVGYKY